MSALYDMISAFIAMLMSAAFLHFGMAGDSRPAPAPASHALASSATPEAPPTDPVVDGDGDSAPPAPPPARSHARRLSAHSRCHGGGGVRQTLDAVHAASPIRRG